jgi:hypothetical protein
MRPRNAALTIHADAAEAPLPVTALLFRAARALDLTEDGRVIPWPAVLVFDRENVISHRRTLTVFRSTLPMLWNACKRSSSASQPLAAFTIAACSSS